MNHDHSMPFDDNEVLRQQLSALNEDVPPMPEELHAQWMTLVKEDAMNHSTGQSRMISFSRRWSRMIAVAAAFVFVITGTLLTKDSLNSHLPSSAKSADAAIVSEEVAESEAADGGIMLTAAGGARAVAYDASNSVTATADTQKIIRTASLTIKTSTYETSMTTLQSLLSQYGGYVEYSSESTSSQELRSASLTLRIPSDSLDDFLTQTETLGRITRRTISADDVTDSYQDTAARLENQRLLLARLQSLTDTAADLSDLLALETQLADTQYTIEQLESSLANTDAQVAHATVRISLTEELQPSLTDTTVSLSDRLASALQTGCNAFVGFLQDCTVFVTASLPFVGIVLLVAGAVWLVRRSRRKR